MIWMLQILDTMMLSQDTWDQKTKKQTTQLKLPWTPSETQPSHVFPPLICICQIFPLTGSNITNTVTILYAHKSRRQRRKEVNGK